MDLREKVARALEERVSKSFTTYEEAADAAIAVCMEEAGDKAFWSLTFYPDASADALRNGIRSLSRFGKKGSE